MAVTAFAGLGPVDGNANGVTLRFPVASGVTVYVNEFVYLGAAGRVTSASIAGVRLLGQVVSGNTVDLDRAYSASATGNAGGTVEVLVDITPGNRYLLKADNDTTTLAVTHQGSYFDLIGNAGSQLVDSSTVTTSGQLVLIKFNPGIRGTDSTYGIYKISERQLEL